MTRETTLASRNRRVALIWLTVCGSLYALTIVGIVVLN